jgi:hypothetical protein
MMVRCALASVLVIITLGVAPAGGAVPARVRPQPGTEVSGYRVVVESISQYQEATLDRGQAAVADADYAPRHQLGLGLRVNSPDAAAAAAFDGFVGPFQIVTDRGQTLSLDVDLPGLNAVDSPPLQLETTDLDLRARSLERVSGRLRLYPRGELVQLRLDAREGAEVRQPNGLTLRLARLVTTAGRVHLEVMAEWPDTLHLRGARQLQAFRVTGETIEGSRLPAATSETVSAAPAGRKRQGVAGNLGPLRAALRALVFEAAVRTGEPVERPFTLRELPLPLGLAASPGAPAPGPASLCFRQEVLLNGKPAGPGTLEVGVSSPAGAGWGPWRWFQLPTDERGAAELQLPAPGRYRLLRRWRPLDEAYARLVEAARWENAQVELTASARGAPRIPPLAATGVPERPAASSPASAAVQAGPYRVRVLQIRETARSYLVFDALGLRGDPRTTRTATITLEITAADADSQAALAGAALSAAIGPDGRRALPSSPDEDQTLDTNGTRSEVGVLFRSLAPEWRQLRNLEGELIVYPRSRAATLEIPLPAGAGAVRQADLLNGELGIVVRRDGGGAQYQLDLQKPEEGSITLPGPADGAPALLDAQRQALRAPLRVPVRQADDGRSLRLSFAQPEAAPAFLRLPLYCRFGRPERRPFRLENVPLPLGALAR